MADPKRRHPANVAGPWFVDTTCINCDAARHVAPGLIEEVDDTSVFVRQPQTPEEELMAWRAVLVCPTGSVGRERGGGKPPEGVFPWKIGERLYYLGFNAQDSFGATSYLLERKEGNVMVDSPKFVERLRGPLGEMGGVSDILLTHRDDVADAQKWAREFEARVWIGHADRRAAPFATDIVPDGGRVEVHPGLVAIHIPGHTKGHVAYLAEDRYLFTGDSVAWSREDQDLYAFADATWYSWDVLADSLMALSAERFEWVLPGHGQFHRGDDMPARLRALAQRMKAGGARSRW
jgi:glyoxylase-like metal-dependent hydrolase (beta-lactamase superfamily II)